MSAPVAYPAGKLPDTFRAVMRGVRAKKEESARMSEISLLAGRSVPELIAWGKRSIEAAGSFDEVRDIRAKADALAAYQKSLGAADEAVMAAKEIRERAERRMGQELSKVENAAPGPQKIGTAEVPNSQPPTLAELGISKNESKRYQDKAAASPDQFDAALDAARDTGDIRSSHVQKLSRQAAERNWSPGDIKTAAREMAGQILRKQQEERPVSMAPIPKERLPWKSNEAFDVSSRILGRLTDFEKVLALDPVASSDSVISTLRGSIKRDAIAVRDWLSRFIDALETRDVA